MSEYANNERSEIVVAVVGNVSKGKTTFQMMVHGNQSADPKKKRDTGVPIVYKETDDYKLHRPWNELRAKINEVNKKIMENGELTSKDIKEFSVFTPKIFDLIKLKRNVHLSIFDLPGMNDSQTKELYYEYFRKNCYRFDIVIFVSDIETTMNGSDETDLLKMVLLEIKNNKTKHNIDTRLMILFNKCDEMEYNDVYKKYMPTDKELIAMYNQADKIIKDNVQQIYPELKYHSICLSCEDSFIYRTYKINPRAELDEKYLNKFGNNEFGKNNWNKLSSKSKKKQMAKLFKKFDYDDRIKSSGYQLFKKVFQEILSDKNQYRYLLNHVRHEVSLVKRTNPEYKNTQKGLTKLSSIRNNLLELATLFRNPTPDTGLVDHALKVYMDGYYQTEVKQHLDIVPNDDAQFKAQSEHLSTFKMIQRFFTGSWDYFSTSHDSLERNLNQYHLNKLKNVACTVHDMKACFLSLQQNNFKNLRKTVVDTSKAIDTYIALQMLTPTGMINFLKHIEMTYQIQTNLITQTAIRYLWYQYCKRTECFMQGSYWKKIHIKSTNPYFPQIECLAHCVGSAPKRVMKMIDDQAEGKHDKQFVLEDYILNRIYKEHPTDIITNDELIRYKYDLYQLRQKQESKSAYKEYGDTADDPDTDISETMEGEGVIDEEDEEDEESESDDDPPITFGSPL